MIKPENLEKITKLAKEIDPVLKKCGFIFLGIEDTSNSSWDYLSIKILTKPESGSAQEKLLNGEGF